MTRLAPCEHPDCDYTSDDFRCRTCGFHERDHDIAAAVRAEQAAELDKLYGKIRRDECIDITVWSGICSRGTKGCIVRHQGEQATCAGLRALLAQADKELARLREDNARLRADGAITQRE